MRGSRHFGLHHAPEVVPISVQAVTRTPDGPVRPKKNSTVLANTGRKTITRTTQAHMYPC